MKIGYLALVRISDGSAEICSFDYVNSHKSVALTPHCTEKCSTVNYEYSSFVGPINIKNWFT